MKFQSKLDFLFIAFQTICGKIQRSVGVSVPEFFRHEWLSMLWHQKRDSKGEQPRKEICFIIEFKLSKGSFSS